MADQLSKLVEVIRGEIVTLCLPRQLACRPGKLLCFPLQEGLHSNKKQAEREFLLKNVKVRRQAVWSMLAS